MADLLMEQAICDWMTARNWGPAHNLWHTSRQVIGFPKPADPIQEGADGNGIEFLSMHRVMIQTLLAQFPQVGTLLAAWASPPQDPHDPVDPAPAAPPIGGPFDPNYAKAVVRIESLNPAFASEDEFGRYLETTHRPTAISWGGLDPDQTAGIHNYLHARFDDPTSPIRLSNFSVNIFNQRFWKLHGWIDRQWTAYRAANFLKDTDPAYLAALAQQQDMGGMDMSSAGGGGMK